jgi:hypothetical protein
MRNTEALEASLKDLPPLDRASVILAITIFILDKGFNPKTDCDTEWHSRFSETRDSLPDNLRLYFVRGFAAYLS